MRTNAKERKNNARQWYSLLINSYNSKSAVVVQRYKSSNPNINRVQLLACNTIGTPVVISESVDGVRGCLYELFQNIKQLDAVKLTTKMTLKNGCQKTTTSILYTTTEWF